MRKLLTSGAACALLAGITIAQAADVAAPIAPLGALVPQFSWTGFHIGANAGGSWRRFNLNPSPDPSNFQVQQVSGVFVPGRGIVIVPGTTRPEPNLRADADGFIGGGQIGYNLQFGRFVFGVEGDAQLGSGARTAASVTTLFGTLLTAPSDVTIARRFDTDWMASLRVRAGFTVTDRILVYGTGGLALADGKVSSTDTFAITPGPGAPPGTGVRVDIGPLTGYPTTVGRASDRQTHVGWTLGAGVDWAVTDNIIIGVLYRHSDFGRTTFKTGTNTFGTTITQAGVTGCCGPGLITAANRVRLTDDQITLRVSWRFGP